MAEGFVLHGLTEFHAAVDAMVARAELATRDAVAKAAHAVQAAGMDNAPVVSGTLRRSISVVGPTREGFATYSATIGPTAIYGRRVELGFHGADSLGRSFNQEGHPYFGPGYHEVLPSLSAIYAASWAMALKKV